MAELRAQLSGDSRGCSRESAYYVRPPAPATCSLCFALLASLALPALLAPLALLCLALLDLIALLYFACSACFACSAWLACFSMLTHKIGVLDYYFFSVAFML